MLEGGNKYWRDKTEYVNFHLYVSLCLNTMGREISIKKLINLYYIPWVHMYAYMDIYINMTIFLCGSIPFCLGKN